MTPSSGKTLFSVVPPSNSLVSVLDPWRAFWADMAPFKGPHLASCIASRTSEIQGHREVCLARHGGPRTPSTTALIVRLMKTHFFTHRSLIVKSHENRIELVTRPAIHQPRPRVRRWRQVSSLPSHRPRWRDPCHPQGLTAAPKGRKGDSGTLGYSKFRWPKRPTPQGQEFDRHQSVETRKRIFKPGMTLLFSGGSKGAKPF